MQMCWPPSTIHPLQLSDTLSLSLSSPSPLLSFHLFFLDTVVCDIVVKEISTSYSYWYFVEGKGSIFETPHDPHPPLSTPALNAGCHKRTSL